MVLGTEWHTDLMCPRLQQPWQAACLNYTVMPNTFVRISGMESVAVGHAHVAAEVATVKGRTTDGQSIEGCVMIE